MSKYIFPDIAFEADNRFKVEEHEFDKIRSKNYHPVFAFDLMCTEDHPFGILHGNVTVDDYQSIFLRLHDLSKIKIADMFENKTELHFHEVMGKIRTNGELLDRLCSLFDLETNQLQEAPALYQVEVYTSNTGMKAPRIIGFFNGDCTFHIIWLDLYHKLYG